MVLRYSSLYAEGNASHFQREFGHNLHQDHSLKLRTLAPAIPLAAVVAEDELRRLALGNSDDLPAVTATAFPLGDVRIGVPFDGAHGQAELPRDSGRPVALMLQAADLLTVIFAHHGVALSF